MQYKYIVYLIEFTNRRLQNIRPYYYIGSKSNCFFDGNNILDRKGNPYYGSSKAYGYKEAIASDNIRVHILGTYDTHDECISSERDFHIHNDVVADTRFWNLSNATENTYSNPDYATYRNIITGKTVRLHRNHPLVVNREYVGVTAGYACYTNGIDDTYCRINSAPPGWVRGRSKTENFKRGDSHYMRAAPITYDEVMKRINKRKSNMIENPEKYEPGKKRQREIASLTHKGVPKSIESNIKRSISSKDYVVLKNMHTGECIRVKRSKLQELDMSIWKNPYSLAEKRLGSKWYNNGQSEQKFFPEDIIPEKYVIGRLKRNKHEN